MLICFCPVVVAQERRPALSPDQSTLRKQETRAEEAKYEVDTAVYLVHGLAEKILALKDVKTKTIGSARLANLLWKDDELYSRSLFDKALSMTTGDGIDSKLQASLRRRIIAQIARRDPGWAKRLIEAATQKVSSEIDGKARSDLNLSTAKDLLEEDSDGAVKFAERSLQGDINLTFLLDFLLSLRKKNETSANQLFLQTLTHLAQQSTVDVKGFHTIGIYLFTAPDLLESDGYAITLVDNMLVPNITTQRPGVPMSLVRAYLGVAGKILWRSVSDPEQRQVSYALGRLLLPKATSAAPDLAAPIEAAMSAISSAIPPRLTEDSAYKYMDMARPTAEERLNNAENELDQLSRDIAYLDLAFQSWLKGDFKMARIAGSRISDQEANNRMSVLNNFGFPLTFAPIQFEFGPAFRIVSKADLEAARVTIDELKNEDFRARGFVEIASVLLERPPKKTPTKPPNKRAGGLSLHWLRCFNSSFTLS